MSDRSYASSAASESYPDLPPARGAPGRTTATSRLPPRAGTAAPAPAASAYTPTAAGPQDDPFGLHLEGGAADAPELVATQWWVDYVNKPVGDGNPRAQVPRRDVGDALYGALTVTPHLPAGGPPRVGDFPFVNAADAGAVFVRSEPHPRGVGGRVSAKVQYGTRPGMSIKVVVDGGGPADAAARAALQQRLDAHTRQLLDAPDTWHEGDPERIQMRFQREADAILAADPRARNLRARVTSTPHPGPRKETTVDAVDYPAIHGKSRIDATIIVPNTPVTATAGGSLEKQHESSKDRGGSSSTLSTHDELHVKDHDEHTETVLQMHLEVAFRAAWSQLKQNARQDASQTNLYGSAKVAGDLAANLFAKVGAKDVDLGALLPLLGKLGAKVAALLGLKLSVDVDAAGQAFARITPSFDFSGDHHGQHAEQSFDQIFTSLDGKVDAGISVYSRHAVHDTTHDEDRKHDEKRGERHDENHRGASERNGSTWSTSTINYKIGHPTLTLKVTQ